MDTAQDGLSDKAISLWQAYQRNKTSENRNNLAEFYLPLVRIVAGRLAINLPTHIDKDDLLSSGFFGLLDAIERYDIERKNKFETYASVKIKGAMLDYLRSRDWLPVSVRQRVRKYEQTLNHLENELGREATDEEVASAMGITLGELKNIMGQLGAATVMPLDEYIQAETQDYSNPGPQESLERQELQDTLAKAIDRLPER